MKSIKINEKHNYPLAIARKFIEVNGTTERIQVFIFREMNGQQE